MRATELLASRVVDERGAHVGRVRDVRVSRAGWEVVGLAVADGWRARLAHRWGYAEGRAQGPWLLRRLTRAAVERTLFVPAERVTDWGPGVVRIRGGARDPARPA
ncbi:MAG: PRC-barrel domain-containing protein [Actinomycetota bacterium]|nr:PRC-barrel domain-containing protein [Actinomycetota bacterium]